VRRTRQTSKIKDRLFFIAEVRWNVEENVGVLVSIRRQRRLNSSTTGDACNNASIPMSMYITCAQNNLQKRNAKNLNGKGIIIK